MLRILTAGQEASAMRVSNAMQLLGDRGRVLAAGEPEHVVDVPLVGRADLR